MPKKGLVTASLQQIKIDFSGLNSKVVEQFCYDELNATNLRLAENLNKGLDANGKALADYSDSYKEAIRKGQVPGKVDTETTTMSARGNLQRGRNVNTVKDGAELRFSPQHPSGKSGAFIAGVHLSGKYPGWFEFGKLDVERIKKNFKAKIEKQLNAMIKIVK